MMLESLSAFVFEDGCHELEAFLLKLGCTLVEPEKGSGEVLFFDDCFEGFDVADLARGHRHGACALNCGKRSIWVSTWL